MIQDKAVPLFRGAMAGDHIIACSGRQLIGAKCSSSGDKTVYDHGDFFGCGAENDACEACDFKSSDFCQDIQGIAWIWTIDGDAFSNRFDLPFEARVINARSLPVTEDADFLRKAAVIALADVVLPIPISPVSRNVEPFLIFRIQEVNACFYGTNTFSAGHGRSSCHVFCSVLIFSMAKPGRGSDQRQPRDRHHHTRACVSGQDIDGCATSRKLATI
jgi:hypothetical protein